MHQDRKERRELREQTAYLAYPDPMDCQDNLETKGIE